MVRGLSCIRPRMSGILPVTALTIQTGPRVLCPALAARLCENGAHQYGQRTGAHDGPRVQVQSVFVRGCVGAVPPGLEEGADSEREAAQDRERLGRLPVPALGDEWRHG